MAGIHIERNHALGRDGARKAVEDVAMQMSDKLDVRYRWNGDVLEFERSGANGTINVDDATVTVDIRLGMALSPFRGPIEQQIKGYLDQRLR